ncbi:hypothetical protein [Parvularcula oceani]|uniref:hypothetical protein n=1 Tax=Parvularcula oceani TaxID=1247963 RepID=UPI0012DFDBC7|nr:hypothetical protein [Parvularcula oceani]
MLFALLGAPYFMFVLRPLVYGLFGVFDAPVPAEVKLVVLLVAPFLWIGIAWLVALSFIPRQRIVEKTTEGCS